MAKTGARQFGNVRMRASGRYQARYTGPDGLLHNAPFTFERKGDADRWLSLKQAEISKGEWIAPERGEQKLREYAEAWMRDRVLRTRTVELYTGLLKNHLYPTFGTLAMSDIDEATVRRWRKKRLDAGPEVKRPFGPVTVAKAYRLLHAILETAAEEDRIIRRNPCHIEGRARKSQMSGASCRWMSSSSSPKPSRSGIAPWCYLRPSPTCGGVSWPDCAGST
jgi:hypothetical protein